MVQGEGGVGTAKGVGRGLSWGLAGGSTRGSRNGQRCISGWSSGDGGSLQKGSVGVPVAACPLMLSFPAVTEDVRELNVEAGGAGLLGTGGPQAQRH